MNNKASKHFRNLKISGSLWCGCTNKYVHERGHRKISTWNM